MLKWVSGYIVNFIRNAKFDIYKLNLSSIKECSDACNFYYAVGACTRVTENFILKCSKGHLLGGTAYNVLHDRPGHKRYAKHTFFHESKFFSCIMISILE